MGATVALGHGRKVLLVEHLKSQPLSEKVQRQLDRPRKKNTEHKAGSAVKTMQRLSEAKEEQKHGDKRANNQSMPWCLIEQVKYPQHQNEGSKTDVPHSPAHRLAWRLHRTQGH